MSRNSFLTNIGTKGAKVIKTLHVQRNPHWQVEGGHSKKNRRTEHNRVDEKHWDEQELVELYMWLCLTTVNHKYGDDHN